MHTGAVPSATPIAVTARAEARLGAQNLEDLCRRLNQCHRRRLERLLDKPEKKRARAGAKPRVARPDSPLVEEGPQSVRQRSRLLQEEAVIPDDNFKE
eukprot:scaffold282160_cov31-Tisochrysis_lutea.AAC.3